MNHLMILPLLVPLFGGALLLLGARFGLVWQRTLSGGATLMLLAVAVRLFTLAADGAVPAYLIGDWPAPFGIVLVLDRLAALMLVVTAVLAVGALAYAMIGADRSAPGFHALFQFQLLGLNGAFLTGDLFNLFVFFEILLIASYGLLLHGGGAKRTRAGLHYVVLNLAGSSLFLVAVGILYGLTGTLNMADLAQRLSTLPAGDVPLAASGGLLLLVVFGLKAALLPLHFWLPHAYGHASAAVAALFAVMTKVGIYAIIRVFGLVFGYGDGPLAAIIIPWLMVGALLTLLVGSLGVLGARDLRELVGYLIIVSVGTLLVGVALGSPEGLTGALYYLVHTTWVSASLFLLAELVGRCRDQGTRLVEAPQRAPVGLAVLYLVGAVAIAGMPPLSGLIGKLLILSAAQPSPWAPWAWAAVIGSSLLVIVALTRTGSLLFWRGAEEAPPAPRRHMAPATMLLATSPLLVLFGGDLSRFAEAAAGQVFDGSAYVEAVLGLAPVSVDIPRSAP